MPVSPQPGPRTTWVRSPRRVILAAAGVVAVGLGTVGVFVPGLPTTIFLILASYCFARSCPWLEERLLRRRLFATYMAVIDSGSPMPVRARVVSLVAMWASVALSLAVLHASGRLSAVLAGVIPGAAAAGTVAILRFRRAARPPDVARETCSS